MLAGQQGMQGDAVFVAQKHGEAGRHHTPRQSADALAGDGQVLLMLFLMMTDVLGTEDVLAVCRARIEAVLHDAAVP